jgi:hypothetical protein
VEFVRGNRGVGSPQSQAFSPANQLAFKTSPSESAIVQLGVKIVKAEDEMHAKRVSATWSTGSPGGTRLS